MAGSDGSGPAITLKRAAASATVRAIGPAVSWVCEIGMIPEARDHSPQADKAFAAAVPGDLLTYLEAHAKTLTPEVRDAWQSAGAKTSGSWEEVFGHQPIAEECFMAWHFAHYVQYVADPHMTVQVGTGHAVQLLLDAHAVVVFTGRVRERVTAQQRWRIRCRPELQDDELARPGSNQSTSVRRHEH